MVFHVLQIKQTDKKNRFKATIENFTLKQRSEITFNSFCRAYEQQMLHTPSPLQRVVRTFEREVNVITNPSQKIIALLQRIQYEYSYG